jgi:tRNA G18 (ribose-2'-O)-methylase SpoU
MTNTRNIIVILNNIRSNENVGSIFRTCDAAGVSKIILVGYTPAPIDRFGRGNKGLTKASLGAEKFVKWEKIENLKEAISILQNSSKNFIIIGVEQNKKAIDYKRIKQQVASNKHLALVFGNEVDGLSEADLRLCDVVTELPMLGHKESLNVAVCAGIVLYSLITNRIHH